MSASVSKTVHFEPLNKSNHNSTSCRGLQLRNSVRKERTSRDQRLREFWQPQQNFFGLFAHRPKERTAKKNEQFQSGKNPGPAFFMSQKLVFLVMRLEDSGRSDQFWIGKAICSPLPWWANCTAGNHRMAHSGCILAMWRTGPVWWLPFALHIYLKCRGSIFDKNENLKTVASGSFWFALDLLESRSKAESSNGGDPGTAE